MNETLTKFDPTFDQSMFLSKADHIFIMVLEGLMERNLNNVKHYLSEDVYNYLNTQVINCLNDKKIRLFDEMNVKTTHLGRVYVNDDTINVEVKIVARYMDYYVNEDGKYISGNNTSRNEIEHTLLFTKKQDTKELNEARRCPSCGKTLDINHSGVCPYCNSTIDMSKYDYILTEISNI